MGKFKVAQIPSSRAVKREKKLALQIKAAYSIQKYPFHLFIHVAANLMAPLFVT